MLGLTLFSFFIFIVVAIVMIEVRNERKYQKKRRKRRDYGITQPVEKPKHDNEFEKQKQKEKKKDKKLPTCKYPKFTHVRLVEMGLTEEESKEFIEELILQLETQISLIKVELNNADFYQLECLTHNLKGSTGNLGTGGISDLLAEYNTYLKTGTDADIAEVYFEYLKHYTKELREQYL